MADAFIRFQGVDFSYQAAPKALFKDLNLQFGPGWTGVAGANGAGKSTLLALACGRLTPLAGAVSGALSAIYCPQRTDRPPRDLERIFTVPGREAALIKADLGLEEGWPERWPKLSHGERKRLQVGLALIQNPAVLAVDEPTNHLDSGAREILLNALARFRGVGLLVSHDREFLDQLCTSMVFVDPPQAVCRPGNFTSARQEEARERAEQAGARQRAVQDLARLEQTWTRRKQEASGSKARRSKKGLARNDSDARERIDRARCSGQDGARGRIQRQLRGRLDQARTRLEEMGFHKEYPSGIEVTGERFRGDLLAFAPAGKLSLGPGRSLSHPDLYVRPGERIALTGPNGGGKSTLVREIAENSQLPQERLLYLPQEISASRSRLVLEEAGKLRGEELGWVMNMVSRLGSRPERLMKSGLPSPGEVRKLLLALGLRERPWLVILDEPTNHLDLPSMERLESALASTTAALLLVSHDRVFLDGLTKTSWRIAPALYGYLLEVW